LAGALAGQSAGVLAGGGAVPDPATDCDENDVQEAIVSNQETARRWPLLLIAAPAAVAVWSGWVGLAAMCGFGIVHPLPGIWGGLKLNTAITLPIGVEAYGAYALGVWLQPGTGDRARVFAKRSAIGALVLGCSGQVAYHLLAAAHRTAAPAVVVTIVACLPVAVVGFGAALAHLRRGGEAVPGDVAEPAGEPAVAPDPIVTSPDLGAIPGATPEPSEGPREEPPAGPLEGAVGEPQKGSTDEPRQEPRRRPAAMSNDLDAVKARAEYRKSVRDGSRLSDRALGEMFGRSRKWGGYRIREAETGPKIAKAQ
jgi:hypothetical protein